MLLRQTLLYLPAQIAGPCAQVVAALVWTHWLAPGPYGLLTFLVASQDLVFLLCLSWWTQFTLRYLGTLDEPARATFARSEASVLGLASAAQVVVTLLILPFLREPLTPALAVAAVAYVATRSLLTHLGERARAQSRIAAYTMAQLAGALGGLALAYGAVATISATPTAVLAGFAVAQTAGVIYVWRRLGLTAGALLPGPALLRTALSYGVPVLLAGGAAWLAQNAVRIVVQEGAGAEALGLVAVGWGLGQRLAASLAMLVIAASFPLAVSGYHKTSSAEGFRRLALGGVMLMALILPASVGLCLLAKPFAAAFVAAPFRAATIAVLPYAAAAGAVRNIRAHVTEPVFLLIERPAVTFAVNALDAGAVLVCCIAGLALAGLPGAVAGCLAGTTASFGVALVLAHRLATFSFPFRDGAKIVAASAAMAAVLVLVPWPPGWAPMARLAAETTLGATVYAAALAAAYPRIAIGAARRLLAYRVGMGVPLR